MILAEKALVPKETVTPPVDVTVVVAVSTPAAEVDDLIEAYGRELERLPRTYEFVFVLDGVGGSAREALERRRGGKPRVTTVTFARRFGESVALSAGFEVARGDVIVTSPEYVQVDPSEIRRLIAAIDQGTDLVASRRSPRVDPWPNRLQSLAFNWVLRRLLRISYRDLNCNFRAMRRAVLEEIRLYGDLYRFLPVLAERQGFRVREIPVRHVQERGKAGFFGFGVYVRRVLDMLAILFLTKFTHRPLRFFGTIGSVLFAVGAAISAYASAEKIFFGVALRDRPLLLLGVLLVVLGVQVIGFGLVGEIIIFTQAGHLREYKVEKVE